jgi:hypothetical protein
MIIENNAADASAGKEAPERKLVFRIAKEKKGKGLCARELQPLLCALPFSTAGEASHIWSSRQALPSAPLCPHPPRLQLVHPPLPHAPRLSWPTAPADAPMPLPYLQARVFTCQLIVYALCTPTTNETYKPPHAPASSGAASSARFLSSWSMSALVYAVSGRPTRLRLAFRC